VCNTIQHIMKGRTHMEVRIIEDLGKGIKLEELAKKGENKGDQKQNGNGHDRKTNETNRK
jgi:hypothetical protein